MTYFHTKSIFSKCYLLEKQFSNLGNILQILFYTIVCLKKHIVAYDVVSGVQNEPKPHEYRKVTIAFNRFKTSIYLIKPPTYLY